MELLKDLASKDTRIVVLESKKHGTSFARKKGVESATGKYVVFMDQDDSFINSNSIESMKNTISETNASVCQFSHYKKYLVGLHKKVQIIDERKIITAKEVREKEIGSIFESYGGGILTPSVWSKIYLTEVLKDAINCINLSLYFAEDQFLNTCVFLSSKLDKVCIDPSGYYEWDTRFGFSSQSDSALALMKDYNQTKPLIYQMLISNHAGEEVVYRLHLESLYYMRAYLVERLDENNIEKTFSQINEISHMEFVQLAKNYVNNEMNDRYQFDELMFLASEFTPKMFYDRYIVRHTNSKRNIIQRLISKVK